ncbi:MAG: leucine-, isoleucine-, valine-, threonine-, and alanine-binding protein [Desulfobacteraceae bacterium]|nr:MAG: leucine-, isoleucine-, valine-, threonine-, and alanine-binding protein [Desulfobacteraceae bacterium]
MNSKSRFIFRSVCKIALSLFVFAAGFVFPASKSGAVENGVSGEEVVLGMSNALSGPASALGQGIKKGAMAYFDKVNGAGGIHGRRIKVISYDDQYEPKIAVANTEKLIDQDRVFALFGYVGTPTSKAIMPLVNRNKIIFFGPFTGAEFLRNPVNRFIYNVRGSYFDESEAQVDYLTRARGIKKIGLFLQKDAYGLAVKGGMVKALNKRDMAITCEGLYERNTEDISAGFEEIRKENPEAVSMVGTYRAMGAFILKARTQRFNPVFLNVSFVGTAALIKELGADGDGVIVTQVMPSPRDTSLQIIEQYRSDMNSAGHQEFDYTDLEGYVDAVVFTEILKKAGKDLTRETFVQAAESLNVTIGGMQFGYGPKDHQALKKVYMTQISGGKAVPLN